jgi:hypothetical protein
MEQAFLDIKNGGLDTVDDHESNGGFTLSISGGKSKPKRTLIVGNKASSKLRNKILEWGAFKEMYPDIEKLDTVGLSSLCNTVKLVIDSKNCLSPEDTLEVLKMMYELPDEKLSHMFLRRFNFGAPTKTALKSIFVNWVHHLETAVVDYTKARDAYITKNKLDDDPNNVKDLLKNWTALDNYYNIQSSSPILLYSSFPSKPYDLPWLRGAFVEIDVWDLYPRPFYWIVKGVPETIVLDKAVKKFTYLGFCPKRPKFRLQELFKFPLDELHKATKKLGGKLSSSTSYEKIVKLINKKGNLKTPVYTVPEIKKTNPPEDQDIRKQIKWYVEEILEIYKKLKPHFEEVEDYYTDIATRMGTIGISMEKL